MRKLLTRAIFACFISWRISSAASTDDGEEQCRRHTTCSSCTTARYASNVYQGPLDRYQKNAGGSGTVFETIQDLPTDDGHLRGRGGQTSQNEEFLVRFNRAFQREIPCYWCSYDNSCRSALGQYSCGGVYDSPENSTSSFISQINQKSLSIPRHYECDCPLAPNPYPNDPPSLLPNWMGVFLNETDGVFGSSTLMDISLPGTHDSMTYDLSLRISDDAIDNMTMLNDVLHAATGGLVDIFPNDLENFLRLQSKTQQLSITQQLDNGIRFIDFRIMMDIHTKEWYSVHFMQSKRAAGYYFKEIRRWLDAHPEEIIVIWLSKHGLTDAVGENQYPDVTPEEKQMLWREYQSIFADLLIDTRQSLVHDTTISDLLIRSHRLITYVSDYKEFTDSTPFALDAKMIENAFSITGGVFDEPSSMREHLEYLTTKATDVAPTKTKFKLMAMNTAGPGWQIIDAARRQFLPGLSTMSPVLDSLDPFEVFFESCALRTNLPGIQRWCPESLLDIAQLTSYYNQITLDKALEWFLRWTPNGTTPSVSFPNAFYLDALDFSGTIRTGSQLLFGPERNGQSSLHANAKFAYVDTILTYNLHKIYRNGRRNSTESDRQLPSQHLLHILQERRMKHPLTLWDDPELGRHKDWPLIDFEQFSEGANANIVAVGGKHSVGSNEIRFEDSWWGVVSPQITFQSVYAVFASRIRYACVRLGSALLSNLSRRLY